MNKPREEKKKLEFRFEFSAGGIVYKKKNNQIYVLVTQHSQHKGWVFPKGLIEKGEKKEVTAVREVKEEGGVEAVITSEPFTEEYFYILEGVKIKKKVYFFLMEYKSGNIADHDWEMSVAEWLPVNEVLERLTFKGDKALFQKVEKELLNR